MYRLLFCLVIGCVPLYDETPPFTDSYIVQIPSQVDLNENENIRVEVIQNNLSDTQILHIDFADSVTLHDNHGKDDITFDIADPHITFFSQGPQVQFLDCPITDVPVGEWYGSLQFTIEVENTIPSNVLISGSELNQLLQAANRKYLHFSNSYPFNQNDADVSKAEDGSLLLHLEADDAYIYSRDGSTIYADEDMSDAFSNLSSLIRVYDLDLLDTSSCTDMSMMFKNDSKLTTIEGIEDLAMGNVSDLSEMFADDTRLTSLDLSDWDTSGCQSFHNMFYHCSNLTSVGGLNSWNTSETEDLSGMFNNCQKLISIGDVSSWNTENVTDMSSMFEMCKKLETVGDISSWDVGNVESFASMFFACAKLGVIDSLSVWNISDHCNDLSYMFYDCDQYPSSSFDIHNWDVSEVNDMSGMFYNCFQLQSVNISGWNTENLIDAISMFECTHRTKTSSLRSVNGIDNLDTSNLQNISAMFKNCNDFDADLSLWNTSSLSDISYAFYGNWNLHIDKLKDWNVSNLVNMQEAFGDDAGVDVSSSPPSWYH